MNQDKTEGGSHMLISSALLRKAKAVLEEAKDKEGILKIPGTAMGICPREMVSPSTGFDVYTYIEHNERSYAIGVLIKKSVD